MQKILTAVLVIGLVATIAGAGIYAYFTDTETSTGNAFTAGTLDISLGTSSWSTGFNNMKPGDTVTFTITVYSDGTLPLDYTISPVLSGDLSTACSVTEIIVDGNVYSDPETLSAKSGDDTSDTVDIIIQMSSDALNWYQGTSGTLTVTFDATSS